MEEFVPKLAEKHWSPSRERELYELWIREGMDKFDLNRPGEVVVIDTPPPYPSGKWHVGGAAHYAQIDMIARYLRLKGYNVLVPFYADRNGLPVEVQVEKATGVNPHAMASTPEGRAKFLEMCRSFLDKVEEELVGLWRSLGCVFEYWRDGTDSPEYRRLTQATFIELYRRGLVYEAERPVNWCPRCRTSLADAELEYEEREGVMAYVKFRVKETGEDIVVATTRPELLRSCAALAFRPGDERYEKYRGMTAINPLYGHEMKILAHPEVDPEFGTGIMMVCSYGDKADVKMFRDLGLEPHVIVDRDGVIHDGGPLEGLRVEEARSRAIELLASAGRLVKVERVRREVPVCWRCKTPVQIVNAREWFLRQLDFKQELRKAIDGMEFRPPMHKQKLLDWLESISSDWPITRDRYYATEVPVWRCRRCGAVLVPEPGKYYRPWIESPPWDRCPRCGAPASELEGERKVFDTWFDSSISVLYATGYGRNERLYSSVKFTIRPQGIDIIRTWLYYSTLRVYQLTGRPPFKYVRLTGMGLDERGEAMHKSKGNVIDPEPYIAKYGADAFRFWAAASAKLGYDYRFSEQLLRTGYLFTQKLWNIARFVSSFPDPQEYSLRPIDAATLQLLGEVLETVDRAYSELDVYEPANALYQFAWNYFASHYVELVKSRAYNREGRYSRLEQAGAWHALHRALRATLVALAPIMPFVTDAIYRGVYGESVHLQRFPKIEEGLGGNRELAVLAAEINSAIWGYKKRKSMKLSEPLAAKVYLPASAEPVLRELVDLHRLERVELYEGSPPQGLEHIGAGIYVE